MQGLVGNSHCCLIAELEQTVPCSHGRNLMVEYNRQQADI